MASLGDTEFKGEVSLNIIGIIDKKQKKKHRFAIWMYLCMGSNPPQLITSSCSASYKVQSEARYV